MLNIYILNKTQQNLQPKLWLIAFSLLAAAVYLPQLGLLPLYLEEPRRALIAANMLASGDYLIPVHAGHIYLGKPPLFNWLILATSYPFGTVTTWSARLPSVFAIWLTTLFLVNSAWAYIGKNAAIFWGCALLLSPEILLKGQLAEVDIVFTGLISAALWSWWQRDQRGQRGLNLWLTPLLLITLAYFTKREPALVFFYLTIGPYLFLHGRSRELFSTGHLSAVAIAAIPILAWLVALATRIGWMPLWDSMLHEVLLRGEGTSWQRYLEHVVTYPLQILGTCAPFSLLLLPFSIRELRHEVWTSYGNVAQFAAIAVLANLPLYWFKGGHLAVRYFLPMFPFLLLLSAISYATLLTKPQIMGHLWLRRLLPGMVALMLLLRGLEFAIYQPLKAKYLEQTQNAPAIIADITQRLPPGHALLVSERIPSAIWFYAPRGLLHVLDATTRPANGDYVLRHVALTISGITSIKLNTYHYENDTLFLERIVDNNFF